MGLNRIMMKYSKDDFIAYVDGTLKTFEDDKIDTVSEFAFSCCTNLTSINLHNATTIDFKAFSYCLYLTSVELPNAINLKHRAFHECGSLTSVNFPNVTTIGPYAFDLCFKLTSVYLPSATNIDKYAFRCGWRDWSKVPSGMTKFPDRPLSPPPDINDMTPTKKIPEISLTDLDIDTVPTPTRPGGGALSSLTSIHFAAKNKEIIENLEGFASKFGAPKATVIYFDL